MSATNRNGLARQPGDFYETPPWAIDVVLDALAVGPEFDGYVIDPGCGNGAIANRIAERAPNADIRGIEKNEELLAIAKACRADGIAWEHADWLTWELDGTPDLIVCNPPYGIAEAFVRKAIDVAGKKGVVAMLLRQSWVSGKTRRAFWQQHKADLFMLERRPSFNRSGTDATDYAWFVFGPKHGGRWKLLLPP